MLGKGNGLVNGIEWQGKGIAIASEATAMAGTMAIGADRMLLGVAACRHDQCLAAPGLRHIA